MKVIILCGGVGTRMKEETEYRPKPMVEIGGQPMLWHIMKIYAHHGYGQFILTLGYKSNMIKDYFLKHHVFSNDLTWDAPKNSMEFHSDKLDDFKITFADTGLESFTGERILRCRKYLNDEDFMITYGDGVGNVNIEALVGKRILAVGDYSKSTKILKITDIKDLEVLSKTPIPVPTITPSPSVTPVLVPTP